MFALAVVLSVVGLMVGPILASWARGRASAVAALDGATLGLVPALIVLQLLPHLVAEIGGAALAGLVAGYLGYQLLEARSHGGATSLGLALVLPTLGIHAFFDGAALAVAFQGATLSRGSAILGAALVLHKVPEGLFLSTGLSAGGSSRSAFIRVAVLAAATVLGAVAGHALILHVSDRALSGVVAVGLGVMLRMILHQHAQQVSSTTERRVAGMAFLACLALVVSMPSPDSLLVQAQRGELTVSQAFVPLFLESAPWLLAVFVGMEIVSLAWPVGRWAPVPRVRSVLPSYAMGVALALALEASVPYGALAPLGWLTVPLSVFAALVCPLRAAGAVVVAAVAVHKGAPLAAGLAFLLTAATILRQGSLSWWQRGMHLAGVIGVSVLLSKVLAGWGEIELHAIGVHAHGATEWIAAVVLLGWIAVEFVREGPRSWFRAAVGDNGVCAPLSPSMPSPV